MQLSIEGGGVYVPADRLLTRELTRRWQSDPGDVRTKAVPKPDENALTMATKATQRALAASGTAKEDVTGVVFASMTHPQVTPEASAELATMIDLPDSTFTVDVCGSPRAGVNALVLGARSFPVPNTGNSVLVVAADVPYGCPGSDIEASTGGGAVALLLSSDGGALQSASTTVTGFAPEAQQRDGPTETADDRFARERQVEAVGNTVDSLDRDDRFDHAVVQGSCGVVGTTDVDALREAENHAGRVLCEAGDARTATPMIGLCRAFDAATPGETVGLVGYGGGGCTAIAIKIEAVPEIRGLESVEAAENEEPLSYVDYLDRMGVLTEDT